ncbi:MAG: ATP-binding cassette domain-containing protein [Calditrichia bacterium]
MIRLENISKSFNGTRALKNLSLIVPSGRTTVIIGPSGCGKSTLIRVIVGLIKPDSGTIHINDNLLDRSSVRELRRNIGYVIQEGGLFPHLTAAGNISLMAKYLGWKNEKIRDRLRELCELTKFPRDGLSRYPVQLSGGQNQRVSLMRALMLDPDTLLLDEPLGALDPLIRYELQTDLKEIFRSLKSTVLLVTHDIGEAAFFGDTILMVRDGEILQKGTIQDLVKHPADPFVSHFIMTQRSPMEFLESSENEKIAE